ncbi:MAG: septal ring lytic transglycosylase RlpA family protein [Acidobacteriia bacterium]|nr:septal ring lytic transglycosylase RlpA family protein [Terriglobia bacterium]
MAVIWGEFSALDCAKSVCLVCLMTGALSCGGKAHTVHPPVSSPPQITYRTAPPPGPRADAPYSSELVGIASYYGDPHNGRPTANGEVFDKHALTAAHRTLPFNTRVRVNDLDNHRSVEVRINDRGPFIDGRIIDLSEEAGRRMGLIGPGTAHVRLDILSMPADATGLFTVQVGAFSNRSNADHLRSELSRRFDHISISRYDSGLGVLFRVRVGAERSLTDANHLAYKLQGQRLPTFVIRD